MPAATAKNTVPTTRIDLAQFRLSFTTGAAFKEQITGRRWKMLENMR